jgi:hypothetical protein
MIEMKKLACSVAVAIALGSSSAQAVSINVTDIQFYDASGFLAPSAFEQPDESVFFNSALEGYLYSMSPFFTTYTANQTMWDDVVTGSSVNWSGTSASGYYSYDYTLGAGEVAVGLLFDYYSDGGGGVSDIAILQIFDCSDAVNCIGVNNDPTHAGVPGSEMVNGPWAGQHITFSGSVAVPVPAAIWLFGSGLVGLIGFARCKKA